MTSPDPANPDDDDRRRDDALRAAVTDWYEASYPGYSIQDFAVVATGQTLEQTIGDGDGIGSAWLWLTRRGQMPHRTSGLLAKMIRAVDRDSDADPPAT